MIGRTRLLLASAAALALLAAAACTVAPTGSSGIRTPQARQPSGSAGRTSATTCYTPRQLEVAYGVEPLLRRGIDGRGETVVLPELAETQLNPLW
jgi:subtilase family serine protease